MAEKSSVSIAVVASAKLLRFTPRVTKGMCEKCGHVGQLWQWWKLSFCRVCRCFSVKKQSDPAGWRSNVAPVGQQPVARNEG